MRKFYKTPEMEISVLRNRDIICDSTNTVDDVEDAEGNGSGLGGSDDDSKTPSESETYITTDEDGNEIVITPSENQSNGSEPDGINDVQNSNSQEVNEISNDSVSSDVVTIQNYSTTTAIIEDQLVEVPVIDNESGDSVDASSGGESLTE